MSRKDRHELVRLPVLLDGDASHVIGMVQMARGDAQSIAAGHGRIVLAPSWKVTVEDGMELVAFNATQIFEPAVPVPPAEPRRDPNGYQQLARPEDGILPPCGRPKGHSDADPSQAGPTGAWGKGHSCNPGPHDGPVKKMVHVERWEVVEP